MSCLCTISITDIVATGDNSFYFVKLFEVNWMLEFCFGVRAGNVGFYDGTRARIVLMGLFVPTGINVSPDGK